jgi:hypothetical protein
MTVRNWPTGAEAWYPELRFATRSEDAVDDAVVEPSGFLLEPIIYGFGVDRFYQLKVRRLKTKANQELRLNHVVFPASLFARVSDRLRAGPPLSQPYIANPEPHGSSRRTDTCLPGFRTVVFDHSRQMRQRFIPRRPRALADSRILDQTLSHRPGETIEQTS